uniref:Uncharacterized protein n=1 Tax=Moniliophthora roreri TaxID=221103 RepID=A0A0W0FKP1_MONRR
MAFWISQGMSQYQVLSVVMLWGETAFLIMLEVILLQLDKLYHTLVDSGGRQSNYVDIYLNFFKEGVATIDAAHRNIYTISISMKIIFFFMALESF